MRTVWVRIRVRVKILVDVVRSVEENVANMLATHNREYPGNDK